MTTWQEPTKLERVREIRELAKLTFDYLLRRVPWWDTPADIGYITEAVERLATMLRYLRNAEGRCKQGHVIVPGRTPVTCTQCGAREVS